MAEDEASSVVNPAAAAPVDGADNGMIRAVEEGADSMEAAAMGVAQDNETAVEGRSKDSTRAIVKICQNILLMQVKHFFVLFFAPIGWSPTGELL